MAVYHRKRTLKSGKITEFWQAIVDLGADPSGVLDATGKPKRRQRAETFSTEREAKKRERAWLAEIDRGLVIDHSPKTVADVLTHWLDTHGSNLKPKSLYEYRRIVTQHIIPDLGSIQVQKLTRARVEQFYNDKRAAGCGGRTLELCHERLSQALDHAVDLDLVPRNVADRARCPRAVKKEKTVWEVPQAQRFMTAAQASPYGPIWAMLTQSGMRRGEVMALRWQDVDFTRGLVSVRRTVGMVGSKLVEGEPKTKSSRREVPIPIAVMAALRTHKMLYNERRLSSPEGWHDNGLVFSSERGTLINPSNLRRDFLRWKEAAGVPQLGIHDLRHTYVTLAVENGADLLDVSKHVGHARPSITMDIYAHLRHQDHSRVADRVGDLFTAVEQ